MEETGLWFHYIIILNDYNTQVKVMRFVTADALNPGMVLAKKIISSTKSFMLAEGTQLTEKYVRYLREKGYLGAYISDSLSEGVVYHETVSDETFESGVAAVAEGNVESIIDVSKNLVQEIVSNTAISVDLVDLRSYDDYTYHHSVNVGVYSVAVGRVMGLSSVELEELAIAALCHDLGKSRIPNEVLNKPGRLTDEEYDIIKNHAKFSYDILYDNDQISAAIRQAVLMHHENENGTGYPLGRTGDEIPKFAKIIHACDVYDALTSKRSYKDPYPHDKAHEYMRGGEGTLFDEQVVEAIENVIPIYPPGIDIVLSNGEEAIVLDQTADPTRPLIRLKHRVLTIDLSNNPAYKDITIVSSGAYIQEEEKVEALNENRSGNSTLRKLVMVVDDSSISLMQTQAAIGNNYDVVKITNGIDAISYIKEKRVPDLIIMDVEMPVVNGISAVRTIRDNGYTKVPVIFLTASCDRETVMKGKAVGAIDYIIKPANPTYLKERVTAAIEGEIDR